MSGTARWPSVFEGVTLYYILNYIILNYVIYHIMYFILFYFILFYFILFYFILFYFILFYLGKSSYFNQFVMMAVRSRLRMLPCLPEVCSFPFVLFRGGLDLTIYVCILNKSFVLSELNWPQYFMKFGITCFAWSISGKLRVFWKRLVIDKHCVPWIYFLC